MQIPTTLTERQVWEAAKPLFDLLGVTPMHVYGFPTIERGDDMILRVKMQVVASPEEPLDWPTGITGDGEFDEVTYEVEIPTSGRDPIPEFWPDLTFPEATRAKGVEA